MEAKPDPEVLAARFFAWEVGGNYAMFYGVVKSYADVLGEKGLAEYRRLAEEEWAKVPTLGPGGVVLRPPEIPPDQHHASPREVVR